MSAASITAEGVGVRFLFDRHQRAVTPALARLRRTSTRTWGVHELGFTIGPGEGVALIGPSGSGKTTVLRLIAGVLEPGRGAPRRARPGRIAALDRGRAAGSAHRQGERRAAGRAGGHVARPSRGRTRADQAGDAPRGRLRTAGAELLGGDEGAARVRGRRPHRPRHHGARRGARGARPRVPPDRRRARPRVARRPAGSSSRPGTTTRCWPPSATARSGWPTAGSPPMGRSRRSGSAYLGEASSVS